ncbi:MAG: histidine kinase [Candidatus Firestonebacteria bacterium RIFOXYC2_FULL_39_67]|nr:MAG: histidine kinase [Candidatus Firestonebacteria bacterium RIFOXYD2_FULL_39_29]OGF55719.1 MAG: histidine kinase [Candidatus Firestonebacteria bacterium RIFOXYC2_FULL_39_67]
MSKVSKVDKHLKAVSEISRAITSNLYLEDILRLIVTVTAEVMNSKICSLLLLDENKKELVIRATQSISDAYNRKPNIKLGEGIAGRVAIDKIPMVISDVRTNPNYLNRDVAKKEGLVSLLAVPMLVKGKIIGVFNLYTSKPHEFSQKEIDILTSVASQAAIAIENAELMVKTKIIEEELAERKLVEKAKSLLIKKLGMSEEDAYKKIQRRSMDSRKSMKDVAEAIILASDF